MAHFLLRSYRSSYNIEFTGVDMLLVELSMEQEKNGALGEELRKKKDDYEELCKQMKREVGNSFCFQTDLAEGEEAVSQTNKPLRIYNW